MREEQGEERQLTSSKVPERMGIRRHEQGTAFPSKGISFLSFLSLNKNVPAHDCLCVQNKKVCRLKINNTS